MKKALLFLLLLPNLLKAQKWVDTTYQIRIDRDSIFGSAVDFAGNVENLRLDIAYPTNDTPPECGRPLVIVVYGGAWMAGDKSVGEVQRLMKEFAKRGYVAIAPNYRLGMFQSASDWNCNISSMFDIEWNCLNAQDSSEWYRAYYRAIQDVKGSLRYMVNRKDTYNINPNNIFTTGFSAGGFTALGTAFLDHSSEWNGFANTMADAKAPNSRYDAGCIKKYQWDTSIASMSLVRPSLGSYEGNLNYPATSSYKIKAVGNLFGGMIYNLLDSGSKNTAIYGFHQPNDLIVPYQNKRKVFHGLNACAYTVCNLGILNRPFVYSSPTIRGWAQTAGVDMLFDSTNNNTDCAGQIADPSKGGHQLDNWSKTWNMATYFASKIDTTDCNTLSSPRVAITSFSLSPNPTNSIVHIASNSLISDITVVNLSGQKVYGITVNRQKTTQLNLATLDSGIYWVQVSTDQGTYTKKLILE